MPVNFDDLMYSRVHARFSVTAVIMPVTSASAASVEVIDKTDGVILGGFGPDLATLKPAAVVRVSALTAAGLTRADLKGATLLMNGITWNVDATQARPSPSGQSDGEILMELGKS